MGQNQIGRGQAMKRLGLTILSVVADLCAIGTVIYWLIISFI